MREIIRWWGIRVGVALLLGTIMAVLTGSAVLGAVATGVAVWTVVSVAWDARRNRGNAAYGNRLRRSGGAADGAPTRARAAWARELVTAAGAASMVGAASAEVTAAEGAAEDLAPGLFRRSRPLLRSALGLSGGSRRLSGGVPVASPSSRASPGATSGRYGLARRSSRWR
ncbi:MAG: hypothetical protein M3P37_07870 [Actinomycetota bacterium]|nr:hypothetical protein [Actinomycetota bacterium]